MLLWVYGWSDVFTYFLTSMGSSLGGKGYLSSVCTLFREGLCAWRWEYNIFVCLIIIG